MKFLTITLIVHAPDPVTGAQPGTTERFAEVIESALLAEELGFDGFGVGERHERPFISSSPPVVLSHIAALTSRIRLFTAVTTLSLLDPVRAYEDYATLDHLSGGRLELIIGKGNGAAQRELFNVTTDDQWDRNAESYELFRRIWREPKVTARPRFRPALNDAEIWPRPLQQPDPGLARQRHQPGVGRPGRPLRRSAVLGQRHQPDRAVRRAGAPLPGALGALRPRPGAGRGRGGQRRLLRGPPVRRTRSRPTGRCSPGYLAFQQRLGLEPVFATLEDFVERSSALIGSPQQVIDKVHRYHEQFGHSVLHLHAEAGGLTPAQHRESLELFQSEIAPVLRRDIPDPPWPWSPAGLDRSRPPTQPAIRRSRRRGPLRRTPDVTANTPLAVLDLVPIPSGSTAAARPAQQHRPGPAGRAPGLRALLVRRAPPEPRRGRHLAGRGARADRRGHVHDPDRLRRGPARPPHRAVDGRGVRPDRRAAPRPARPRPGPVRRQAARPGPSSPRWPARPAPPGAGPAGRPADPAAVSRRAAAGLAALRDAAAAAAAARRPSRRTTPSRSPTCWPCCAAPTPTPTASRPTWSPARARDVQVWILGSSGGESAQVAGAQRAALRGQLPRQPGHRAGGRRGLPGRVPAVGRARPAVRERVGRRGGGRGRGHRARAGDRLRPVGAQHPHRRGRDRVPDPGAGPRARLDRRRTGSWSPTGWTPSSSGTPAQVADQLEVLRDATGADELIVTTITHEHADRVRSYELLAQEWQRR